jgi:putative phosphonate metabolism protein
MGLRYAIYYAPPPDDPLASFGATWLGRCAERDAAVPQPELDSVAPDCLYDVTAEPRRYGFHATLKPPFALAEGFDEGALLATAGRFAARQRAFDLPPLSLAAIGRFLALIPTQHSAALHTLADDCVGAFDEFRRPASEGELARRRANGLTARQDTLLRRWGYPYVFDEYRFHMTLTGKLSPEERATIEPGLRRQVMPLLKQTRRVDQIAVFVEETQGAPFKVRARFPLGA